jgi:acyl-CoA thioester hydrolase
MIVRSYEVDGFRHVNNATYMQYLEAARGAFLRAIGLGYAKFHEWEAYPVVVHAELDYESSARADEELEIEVTLAEWRRTQFKMTYQIRNVQTGVRIVRAETHHAFTDPQGRPKRVPDAFREAFENGAEVSYPASVEEENRG